MLVINDSGNWYFLFFLANSIHKLESGNFHPFYLWMGRFGYVLSLTTGKMKNIKLTRTPVESV